MAKRSLSAASTPAIVHELAVRRAALAGQIAELDAILGRTNRQEHARSDRRVGTSKPTAKRVPPKQGSGNAMTLSDAIAQVIGESRKTVAEIVAGIPSTGYQSRSADFHKVIGVNLAQNRKRFKRVGRGVYAVKK